jgi:phosphomannomutase
MKYIFYALGGFFYCYVFFSAWLIAFQLFRLNQVKKIYFRVTSRKLNHSKGMIFKEILLNTLVAPFSAVVNVYKLVFSEIFGFKASEYEARLQSQILLMRSSGQEEIMKLNLESKNVE